MLISWNSFRDLSATTPTLTRHHEFVSCMLTIGSVPVGLDFRARYWALLEFDVEYSGGDLEAVIDFPGFLSRETFFSQVQVPVICSNIENLPYAVMEAMAHGLAGVATRVGGLPDLIEDGQTGYLVEPRDDAALAEKIQRLLDHPEEAKAFGQAGLEKLQREFSPAQAVEAHLALYEELLNS